MRRSYAVCDSPIARFIVSFGGGRRDGVWRHAAGVGRRAARAAGARARRRVCARVDGARPCPRGVPRRHRAASGGRRARCPHLRRAADPRGVRRPADRPVGRLHRARRKRVARPVRVARHRAARARRGLTARPRYAPGVGFQSIDELEDALRAADYLPDRGLSTALYLALALSKPVLLEGEAGVGKTEAAKALASVLDARLIRLQCYEGLDVAHAVYEWNYPRQLLHIRAAQEGTLREEDLFGPEYLIRRPLLEAIDSDEPVVLLIDEIDRADEEFEAFLLEVLSDFQITIPELGTIAARRRPAVILTSNRTRELHDALKRRALYHWIGHPSIERAMALEALGRRELDAEVVQQTLGSVLKYHEDIDAIRDATLARLVEEARAASAAS